MKNLLFAPETINIAEVTRMIEIAKTCRDRFNCEFFGYGGDYAHLIEEAGFPLHLLEPRVTPQRADELFKADRMEAGGKFFTNAEMITRATNELALYKRANPAAIVIGFTLSTLISAPAAKIPLVYLMPFALTRPFFESNPQIWSKLFGHTPLRWLPARWLNTTLNRIFLNAKLWTKPVNAARTHFGLSPLRRTVDLFEGDHNLVTDIPELAGVDTLPEHWRFVGPIFARLDGDVPPEIERLPRDKPLIYFAMGSSANRDVLLKVTEMFRGLPYTVIAPIRAHLPEDYQPPENVHVFGWLPAHKVNPLADLAVIHGGQGTVQTACWSGTPFVGIGL
jgi:UDP:flavonoid glycosyltransferase YjiC (YdhE family)